MECGGCEDLYLLVGMVHEVVFIGDTRETEIGIQQGLKKTSC